MPSKIASMTNAIKVQTSITVMRSPPFGVDRPPSDSPIISSLSNLVNIPQQKTKPLDAQRASWYNLCYKGGSRGQTAVVPKSSLQLVETPLLSLGGGYFFM